MEKTKTLRTQQIRIKKGHRFYDYCDQMSYNAKNLYNIGNFYIRQVFTGLMKDSNKREINEKEVINTINDNIPKINNIKKAYNKKRLLKELSKPAEERKEVKDTVLFTSVSKESPYLSYNLLEAVFKTIKQRDYINLPTQVNQQVLKQLFQDWKSFYRSLSDYRENPSKYLGRPRIPRYVKIDGRKKVSFTNQVCTIKDNKYLKFPFTNYRLNIGKLGLDGKLKEVRILPRADHYIIEIVLERGIEIKPKPEYLKRIIAID